MALREYTIRLIADKQSQSRIRKALEESLGALEINIRSKPFKDSSKKKKTPDARMQSALDRRETVLAFIEKNSITTPRMVMENLKLRQNLAYTDLKYLIVQKKIRKVRTGLYIPIGADWPSEVEIERARSRLKGAKPAHHERAAGIRKEILDLMSDNRLRTNMEIVDRMTEIPPSVSQIQVGYLVKKGFLVRHARGVIQRAGGEKPSPKELAAAFDRSLPKTERFQRAAERRNKLLKLFTKRKLRETKEIISLLDPADVPNAKADLQIMERNGLITRVDRGYYALAGHEEEAIKALDRMKAMSLNPKLTEMIAAVDRIPDVTMRKLCEDPELNVTNDSLVAVRLHALLERGLVKRSGAGTPRYPYTWHLTVKGKRFLPR